MNTLREIKNGAKIVIQLKSNWLPKIIVRKIRDRTYLVKIDNGSEYIRNRIFIKTIKKTERKEVSKNYCLFKPFGKEKEGETKKCYIEIERAVNEEAEEITNESESEYETVKRFICKLRGSKRELVHS